MSAMNDEFDESIEIFEKIGESCLESNLLKFNAKGHFLKAGILVLCKGVCAYSMMIHYFLSRSIYPGRCSNAPKAGKVPGA
jgi:hypothetical protein